MSRESKEAADAAFADFVRGASPSLLRTAWLLTGSADAAHDLVQDALVRTYGAWSRVRAGEEVAYARRILINARTDGLRRRRGELAVAEPPSVTGPGGQGAVDDRDEVVRLLQRLPEQQRRVVVLRYYCDLSEAAVADELGISLGTVKSTASRGLAALRSTLVPATQEVPR